MGIQNITIERNPPKQEDVVPIGSLVSIDGKSADQDYQSGAIFMTLMKNGWQDKIRNGIKEGKTYNIIHTPPNPNFALVETIRGATPDDPGHHRYEYFKVFGDDQIGVEIPEPKQQTFKEKVVKATDGIGDKLLYGALAAVVLKEKEYELQGKLLVKSVDLLKKGYEKMKLMTPKEKITVGGTLKEWFLLKDRRKNPFTADTKPKPSPTPAPATPAPNPGEQPGRPPVIKPKVELTPEQKKAFEEKKLDYLAEKLGKVKIEGKELDAWDRLKKLDAFLFMDPENPRANWGKDKDGKKIKRALVDYSPFQKKLHEDLTEYLKDHKMTDKELAKMTLDELVEARLTTTA